MSAVRRPWCAALVLSGAALLGTSCRNDGPPGPPPPDNRPPVAQAGGPYDVEGRTVSFDASASSDPDGDALTFTWRFADGATAEGARITREFADFGSDTVRLTVTDARGAQATASAPVTRRAPVMLSGAGNIGSCGGPWDERTAERLDPLPGYVFTAGDNAFPSGSAEDYTCFAASWGRHLARMLPVLGNHDYDAGNADAAFAFFGDRVGPRGKGYYSTNVGAWHVIVLNDNDAYVSLAEGSEQLAWLRADLAASQARCTIALWHVPRFLSSRDEGYIENPSRRPVWQVLYAAGVDVVVNGHQHHYERMAPMTPGGSRDDARGIRQFNVGTGGGFGVLLPTVIHPNSEARAAEYGVLSLALRSTGYEWRFIPAAGQSYTDSGSGACH